MSIDGRLARDNDVREGKHCEDRLGSSYWTVRALHKCWINYASPAYERSEEFFENWDAIHEERFHSAAAAEAQQICIS